MLELAQTSYGNGMLLKVCEGVDKQLPTQAEANYPAGLSSAFERQGKERMTFFFDASTGSFRANDCPRIVPVILLGEQTDYWCDLCRALESDAMLCLIYDRALDRNLHQTRTNDFHLTDTQKDARISMLRNNLNEANLNGLNNDRRLAKICKDCDDLTRLKAALTEDNVPRVHKILGRAASEGRSTSVIVDMVARAAQGLYTPRQYDEDDQDMMVLALGLGGRRMVYALNHSGLGPGLRTIKDHRTVPHYRVIPFFIDESIIQQNTDNFIFTPESARREECIWTLMIDGIKGEQRIRHDPHGKCVLGCCYHIFERGISAEIRSPEDCMMI